MRTMTVAVLGGGNGAFAHAAHLALQGFTVNLFDLPEFGENIARVRQLGGINLVHRDIAGFPAGVARLNVVSTKASEALSDAAIVWVVVPAFAQKLFAQACAVHFTPDQIVVLSPGNGGALEFATVLREQGLRDLPKLAEAESMLYSCLKRDATTIMVDGFKNGMGVAALPGTATSELLSTLRVFYPGLRAMRSVLETQLSNVNLVVHAPILLLNLGRAESPHEFEFYLDGCTPSVGKVIEAVDKERIAVGKGLGLELIPIYDWEIRVYGHQGAKGTNLTEVLSTNPAYRGHPAPRTVNHRFLTEDVPYGMVPMERFGALVSVPTPITSSLVSVASEILGTDLRKAGRDWKRLGIEGLSAAELRQYVGQWEESDNAYQLPTGA